MARLLLIDCDSTLSAVEGIDELGRLRGPSVFAEVERMTNEAMDGGTPLETVFARRLDLIRPTRSEVDAVAAKYLATVEPDAADALRRIRAAGWRVAIVSGGFTEAILPLARSLGIERVEAVGLRFQADGAYAGFDESAPTCRSRGKNAVARRLRAELGADEVVMVGDGASDLEVRGDADRVIGFGRYADRPRVRAGADAFIRSFAELPALLGA
ncbi:MAG: HAD-IB family phosphatase [Opitutia bacterium]|jgi:phosphoserine phosphatase